MKIKPQDGDRFTRAPDPNIEATLIYGPDQGLVRERSNRLTKAILGEDPDPMGLVELTESDVKSDPARLADEIAAISMLADKRLVRLRDGGEASAKAMDSVFKSLEDGSLVAEAFVIVEAGALTPRAKLRTLFEKSKKSAALACYQDDKRGLQDLIASDLSAAGLKVTPDAMAQLMEVLGQDRGITRSELDKLALYKGAGTKDFTGDTVTFEDVEALLGSGDVGYVDIVIDAALLGDFENLDRELANALSSGSTTAQMIRNLSTHLERLYFVRSQKNNGRNVTSSIKGLRPPIFFKREGSFQAQVNRWPASRLEAAMRMTLETEIECRKTGAPDVALCSHAFMAIAAQARRLNR